jgi:hypothetical protein
MKTKKVLLQIWYLVRYAPALFVAHLFEAYAQKQLTQKKALWNDLMKYRAQSPSTGCSYADFWTYYQFVRTHKPKEILECGAGLSTIIFAHALIENEKESGIRGRITSMEESALYYDVAVRLLPQHLNPYVDIVLSPMQHDSYEMFRGIRYEQLPDRPYDFVLIDGPDGEGAVSHMFDMDFLRVVEKTKNPVCGLIDTRTSTCFVYHHIFGDKLRYDYVRKIGIIGPCVQRDIRNARYIVAASMARHAFKRPSLNALLKGKY